jgi:hypothetical protein
MRTIAINSVKSIHSEVGPYFLPLSVITLKTGEILRSIDEIDFDWVNDVLNIKQIDTNK